MRTIFTGLTALLMLTVVLQFSLAGRGVYDPPAHDDPLAPHRALGHLAALLGAATVLVGAAASCPAASSDARRSSSG